MTSLAPIVAPTRAPIHYFGSGGGGGKGGGGGGSPRVAQEEPNTLQSKSIARVIDVIALGPIQGLVNGRQSVFYDNTPVQNPDGSENFQGITIETRNGTTDQSYVEGFPEVENEVEVGTEITKAVPIVRTISNDNLDAIRTKVRIPQLTYQNTSNGDLKSSQVQFTIEVAPYGGSYVPVIGNYAWASIASGTTSNGSATGVSAIVGKQIYAKAGDTVSVDLSAEYRAVGAGSWTELGSTTLTKIVPSRSESTDGFADVSWEQVPVSTSTGETSKYHTDKDGSQLYEWWMTATITTQFSVSGLASDQYEIQMTDSTILRNFYSYDPAPFTIQGKNTAPFEDQFLVPLPSGGSPWNVRLTRITDDSEQTNLQNQTYWSTYTELIYAKLTYPSCALVAQTADCQLFGNKIPERAFEIYGRIVQVPSNYDPSDRSYDGIWDGTFQNAWTDNPAWVLYDILTDEEGGMGEFISEDKVDKYALYAISQYCDELIDNGYGGTEPRFTFNGILNKQEQAKTIIDTVAAAFHGMVYWGNGSDGGLVSFVQDSPRDVDKILNQTHIIAGSINYSSSAKNARHSVAKVTWNNPANGYKAEVMVVIDHESYERYKWNEVDVIAFGCTSKGQAHRFGKWILDSERNETETVSFKLSWAHMDIRPGDVVKLADPHYMGVRFGGRILDVTGTVITIDQAVTLESGQDYLLAAVLPDGSVEEKAVITTGETTDDIEIEEAFSSTPIDGALWVLTGTNVEPRKFRVLNVSESDPGQFEVTAIFHDSTKYSRIEENINIQSPAYSTLPTGPILSASNINFTEFLYLVTGGAVKSAVTISWQASPDPRAQFYLVEALPPEEEAWIRVATTKNVTIDYYDTILGDYQFRITPMSLLDSRPGPAITESIEIKGLSVPPDDVSNFQVAILDTQALLTWDPVTAIDLSHYEIRYSSLTDGTATWGGAQVLVSQVQRTQVSVVVPSLVGTYLIKAVDSTDNFSVNATAIISTVGNINTLNVVETITESPTFAGVKIDCVESVGALQLSSGSVTQGYYYFDSVLDLSAVYKARITANISVEGTDLGNDVDEWSDVDAIMDVDGGSSSEWDAALQVCTADEELNWEDWDNENWEDLDDVTWGQPLADWSAWKDLVIGDYKARYFRFRLVLTSYQAGISPRVTALSVTVDMPDRDIKALDVTVPAGGLAVVFSPAYKALTTVGVTGQNLQSGERVVITNKSATGFTMQVLDSSDSGVERTCDYHCKGYGEVSS